MTHPRPVRRRRLWIAAVAAVATTLVLPSAPASAVDTVYEAENAVISQGGVFSNHAGYTGTGFVDYVNTTGGYLEWTVPSATAQAVTLVIRYAHASGVNRPMDITINGTAVRTGLAFPPTASWDTWADNSFAVTLSPGTNRIRATATTANGGPNVDRLTVSTTGGDTTLPTTPAQPSCSNIAQTALDLSWGAASDNVGVAAYDIYHDGNKIAEAAGTATTTRLTGLQINFEYRLSVFARDAAGNVSPSSAQAICRTLASSDTVAPSVPGNFTITNVAGSSATATWTASTDNIGVTGYEVRSGTSVLRSVGNVTTTPVTGLACNTPYTLTVVAFDAAGNRSAPSNARSFTTPACSGDVPSSITPITTGLNIPWGLDWLPDGQSALLTERDNFRVSRVTRAGVRTDVGTVPGTVTTGGEGGLLGVAVDPNWTVNRYVYFMHTAAEGNRIARMTYDGNALSGYTVILQGIVKNRYHNGGRIAFGPDGFLYATTGDAQQTGLAQDRNSLNGKILRMRTDGTAAPGNPFGTLVYSLGHRNPQGIAWDSRGRLWSAEFGDTRLDELNLIKPGLNYGWPICEGICGVAGMENPKQQWSTATASPSGIAIVRDVVYMGALRGSRLWRIPLLDGENTGPATDYFVGQFGRLRTVVKVPGADQLRISTGNGGDQLLRATIS